jgi:hypothetical protein
MTATSGCSASSVTIGEPHFEQNCRRRSWPASVPTVTLVDRVSPLRRSAARGTATTIESGEPV